MLFLNPIFLLAAAALAGPLIYHLLLRNRPKRRILPTLRFLPTASQQTVAMHRLKNLLLLLMRLLILLLIVLAFSRPYFETEEDAEEPEALAQEGAVFALDTSLSMRVEGRWNSARNRVRTLVRTLPAESRMVLMLFDRTPRVACPETDNPASIDAALQTAEAGYASTDIVAAIRSAAEIGSKLRVERKRVYLVSDFQSNGFRQVSLDLALPDGVELVPVRTDEEWPWNAGVAGASEQAAARRGQRRLRVQLASFGAGKGSGELRVFDGARRLASRNVTLERDARAVEDFDLNLSAEQAYALRVELNLDDALEEDNTLACVLEDRGAIPLLVGGPSRGVALGGNGGAPEGVNPYLRAAVAAFGPRVEADWAGFEKLKTLSAAEYPVVLVDSPEMGPASLRGVLEGFVRAGGSLILFPGGGDPRWLADLAGAEVEGWEALDAEAGRYRLVSSTAARNPLPLLDESGDTLLGHPKVYRYLRARAPEPEKDAEDAQRPRAAVRFDNGDPFLIERPMGRGALYFFTTPLDPKAADLVLRAAFTPFLYQLFRHCADRERPKDAFTVGEVLPEAAALSAAQAVLSGPRGKQLELAGRQPVLQAPGLYRLRQGAIERPLAVRIDPEESDLALMDATRVELLAQTGSSGGSSGPGLASMLEDSPDPDSPWRLWWFLLLAALLLMGVETLVAARTTR